MARRKVRLNSKGIGAILKSDSVATIVNRAAEQVADNVRAQNIRVGDKDGGKHERALPVKVTPGTTDRARAIVAIAHPSGDAVQAKHGSLTKAAGQAGLDVRGR